MCHASHVFSACSSCLLVLFVSIMMCVLFALPELFVFLVSRVLGVFIVFVMPNRARRGVKALCVVVAFRGLPMLSRSSCYPCSLCSSCHLCSSCSALCQCSSSCPIVLRALGVARLCYVCSCCDPCLLCLSCSPCSVCDPCSLCYPCPLWLSWSV